MVKVALTIEEAEDGLHLLTSDAEPDYDDLNFATFRNNTNAECVVWFTDDVTFGRHCLLLRIGEERTLRFIKPVAPTHWGLFGRRDNPQMRRSSEPDPIPGGT